MLTLIILLILFVGAYSGYKKGVMLQLLRAIGYTITLVFAFDYYKIVSEYLYLLIPYPSPFSPTENPYHYHDIRLLFSMDNSYYYLISFFGIVVVGWLIVRVLTQLISYTLENLRVPEPFSGIGGAIIGFIVNYLGVFLILLIFSTIPYGLIQNTLSGSGVADAMLTSTPRVSERSYQVFFVDVFEEANSNQPTMEIEMPAEEESAEEENNE